MRSENLGQLGHLLLYLFGNSRLALVMDLNFEVEVPLEIELKRRIGRRGSTFLF